MEPIINLTRKYAKFHWTKQCQEAFQFLKDSLKVVPLLAYPDPNKPYVLYTDASQSCIGACLTQSSDDGVLPIPNVQNEKPIYFLSHKLSDTQTRWSTIEKEAYAIHYALQKLDHYLHNAKFTIKTDHKPLKYILESPMQNKKIQLWALGLSGYNCKVEYIEGVQNTCADLLSRSPQGSKNNPTDHTYEPDVPDKAFEINVINSNELNPKDYASCSVTEPEGLTIPKEKIIQLDMVIEQDKDEKLKQLIQQLRNGEASKTISQKYMVVNDILYYLSNPDTEPTLRLYVPDHLQERVILQYHDHIGHMGIDKTYDVIREKYFWPNLYQQLYSYISKCITCQQRAIKTVKPATQETDIPPYPFAKIGLDLSGPYPETLSGNKYIISFVDLYSGWPEAFAVPDKSAENVAHLIIEEIFPRYGAPLQIVTDNGSENANRIVRETMQALNIDHVFTSFYNPKGNAKVERFHRTLHDVLAKRLNDNLTTWDLHLNQALAAVRFHINESSKHSPFFLVYNRDVILPIDNLLKPRRKYQGEDLHQIALQRQHKTFTLVHRYMKQAKKIQAKYNDQNSKDIQFEIGDPVYYKNHRRKNKLDSKWKPFFRIIERKSPLTYVIRNQLDGTTIKVHVQHLRKAQVEKWHTPPLNSNKQLRSQVFVVPPEESDTDSGASDHSAMKNPEDRRIKFCRKERPNSDNEDDIPLMELANRLRANRDNDIENTLDVDTSVTPESEIEKSDIRDLSDTSESYASSDFSLDNNPSNDSEMEVSENEMMLQGINTVTDTKPWGKRMKSLKTKREASNNKLRTLLKAIVGII